MKRAHLFLGLAAALWLGEIPAVAALFGSRSVKDPEKISYARDIEPLLQKYCHDCHGDGRKKAGVQLDQFTSHSERVAGHEFWNEVLLAVRNRVMPPENKKQPTLAERELIQAWIEFEVFKCDCKHPDPGRVTLRRLNRAEYNNTIRDLVGVDFQPADDFPADDAGYGFDNIGDVLSLSPVLLERYLAAADKILDQAIVSDPSRAAVRRYLPDLLLVGYNARQQGNGWVGLTSAEEDDVAVDFVARTAGEYVLRTRAYAEQGGPRAMTMALMNGATVLREMEITGDAQRAQLYEVRLPLAAGTNHLRAVVRRIKDGLSAEEAAKWKTGQPQRGAVYVGFLEVEGPLDGPREPLPATHQRIITRRPGGADWLPAAREVIGAFARRAYRRPVAAEEVGRLTRFAELAQKNGDTFETGVKQALKAVLVSPHFLFRGELQPEPDNPRAVHPINEFALASRLSYFLWSSMPDAELSGLAASGTLRRNLEAQVRRMLRDPRSRALVDNFAGQWLQLRNLALVQPDPKLFPAYDPALRTAMRRETELLFASVLREDRSIFDFLTADYTFVNGRLAQHYGMKGVTGDEFRRVSLRGTGRAGVLTHASVLTLTSNPTRTSPVKRGKWVLENLLASPPPPPVPGVPELEDQAELKGTLRQRMEQHRVNPTCASCHARMDPIGFGLENFDAIGTWRVLDAGAAVDASGRLMTGEKFKGPAELAGILAKEKKDDFVRCLSEKLLTYALGRGLEHYDRCALKAIADGLAKRKHTFSGLIFEVVNSVPFQMRRGESTKATAGHE